MQELLSKINWVDIFIAILLIRGTYIGAKTGFIWGFFKLFGISVVSILAIQNYSFLAEYISYYTPLSLKTAEFLSFLFITVVGLLIFMLLRVILQRILKIEFAKLIEKPGGIIIGFIYSCVFVSIILVNLTLTPISYIGRSITERSIAGEPFLKVVPQIYNTVMSCYPDIEKIDTSKITAPSFSSTPPSGKEK